ncbi:hypothetical protein BDQ17DRAFT_1348197 [Cyathus striatus]|nr:hypothetical protein BDQ17DRAFT_1348197 [Cyathus striatus]
MNGSRHTNGGIAASVASILGVNLGTLRFRPHGSTQKAHVVLKRVVSSERTNGEATSQNVIQFSLFAAKRIEVKPGKEILLTVASEDDRFMDQPIVLEGDILDAQPESDEEGETQVADEEKNYIPLSEAIIPPKLRRDWTKRAEDVVPSLPLPTYLCTGVQAEPEHASTAVQVENRCASTSTQTEYQNTVSSSTQTVNNLVSSFIQTENNTISSSMQTENRSVSSSVQTENNSIASFVQTEDNSVSTSMQTENVSLSCSVQTENQSTSSSAQTENILASSSVQTEVNTVSQLIQVEPSSVSAAVQVDSPLASHLSWAIQASTFVSMDIQTNDAHDASTLVVEKPTEAVESTVQRSISPYFDGEVYWSRPPSPSVPASPSLDHKDDKFITTSKNSTDNSQEMSKPVSNGQEIGDSRIKVNSSASHLYNSESFTDGITRDGGEVTMKIYEKVDTPQHSVSNNSHLPQSSYVTSSHVTVPRKRKSEELQSTTPSSKLSSALQTSSVPTGPRWLLSHGALSNPSQRKSIPPDEIKASSPPPDPRSLAYIPSGPSSNPLGIRPSATAGLNKLPPIGPRAFVQACKPVVVGNGWSATRVRGPPKGPTALISAVLKDGNAQGTQSTNSTVTKVKHCKSSSSASFTSVGCDNMLAPSPGLSSLSNFPSNYTSVAGSSVDWRRDAPIADPTFHPMVPIPISPSISPPPSPVDPVPPIPSSPPPPPVKWRKVGKEIPPVPVEKPSALSDVPLSGYAHLHRNPLEPPGHYNLSTDQSKADLFDNKLIETVTNTARSSPTPAPSSSSESLSKVSRWNMKRARLREREKSVHCTPPPETSPTSATTTSSSLPPLLQPLNHPLPPKPPQPMGQLSNGKQVAKRLRQSSPEPLERSQKRRKRSFKWPTIETSNIINLQGDGDLAIRTVTFSTDGSHFAVTCPDCSLRIWNSKSRNEITRLTRNSMILGVAWVNSNSGIFVLTEDGTVGKYTKTGTVWQWTKELDVGMEEHSDEEPICFAYAGDRIAVSFPHAGVKVWLWQRGTWCAQRSIVRQNVSVIRFIDGGDAIIGGTRDGVLWYCEVPNGTLRASAFLKAKIVSVDVDPSGQHVLVSDKNGTARLVPIRSTSVKDTELTFSRQEMLGAGNCSLPALFATKGQAVLFGNVDECVLVWDRKKAVVVYGLEHSEDDHIRTIACFDGNATCPGFIITGTKQGQLCWWPLPISA